MKALAFCSEYSVHHPGNGVAYQPGPIQGKAADAIAMLLWRGTIEKGRAPRELQTVSWAIQSGLTYAKMPKTYQAVIDDVIPDFRDRLGDDKGHFRCRRSQAVRLWCARRDSNPRPPA